MTKKPVNLSASDEAALHAGSELERHLTAWEDEGTIVVPEPLLAEIETFLCCFADEHEPWPASRWKLLAQLNSLIDRLEREDGGSTTGTWRPAMLRPATRDHLRRIIRLTAEAHNPPPPPAPRLVPLESIETLVKQGVSTTQICKIYGWVLENGQPDVDTFRKAEKGEIPVPSYKELAPASDGTPTRRPHNGRLMYWADRVFAERETDHASLVGELLAERDKKAARAARLHGRRGAVQEHVDAHGEQQVEQPEQPEQVKRGRGRPRKAPRPGLELESANR